MAAAGAPKVLRSNTEEFYWWPILESLADPGMQLSPWRSILDDILEEIPSGEDLIITARMSEKTEGQFFKLFPAASAAPRDDLSDLTEKRA